jgi:NAD(P)-dependent dehydrogenase (short-subunit alcohol dehydrogenase family)
VTGHGDMAGLWSDADIPALDGRVAVVTGGNSGIGYEVVRALLRHGAEVYLACRDLRRGEVAARELRSGPNGRTGSVRVMAMDLASLAAVDSGAAELMARASRLDLLINNAGVSWTPYRLTADGFELQLGTNHLGHFALTGRLLPLLLATPGSRVVATTSQAHRHATLDLDDFQMRQRYRRQAAYSRSKLANLLFAYGLQRRLAESGATTTATCANPGSARTGIDRNCPVALRLMLAATAPFAVHSPAAAAAVTLRAATDTRLSGGDYLAPGRRWELVGPPVVAVSSPCSYDVALQDRVWEESERITGVRYRFLPAARSQISISTIRRVCQLVDSRCQKGLNPV